MIAASLCLTLWDSRTDVKQTRRLIYKLMFYAVNQFVLVTVFFIVQMILVLAIPQNRGFLLMDLVVVHLKTNSVLATINARTHLRRMNDLSVITNSDVPSSSRVGTLSTPRFVVGSVQPVDSLPPLNPVASFGSDSRSSDKESGVNVQKETYVV
ncbi:hypothetical protein VKT23_013403 [Stygiomarasmius scandens]|uniref:DUF6534 domain-containing protein n=1 Tax=Marasmiellus scandens TaxID=2682957 RepID=A0ABR1J3E6_9AGAR